MAEDGGTDGEDPIVGTIAESARDPTASSADPEPPGASPDAVLLAGGIFISAASLVAVNLSSRPGLPDPPVISVLAACPAAAAIVAVGLKRAL